MGRTTILINLADDVWRDVQAAAKRRDVSGETLCGYWLEQYINRRTRGLITDNEPAGTWSDTRAAEQMIGQATRLLEHAQQLLDGVNSAPRPPEVGLTHPDDLREAADRVADKPPTAKGQGDDPTAD
jgi:hypothetical protein